MTVTDLDSIRQACEPIARWWDHTQQSGLADPDRLARSLRRAKLLGPVPGPLGAALAYILDGCPDLDYPKVHDAFSRIAAAASQGPRPVDLGEDDAPDTPVQLRLAGMPGPAPRPARQAKGTPA